MTAGARWGQSGKLVSPALTPGVPGLVVCAGGRGAVKWEVEGAAESCASGVGKRGLQWGRALTF